MAIVSSEDKEMDDFAKDIKKGEEFTPPATQPKEEKKTNLITEKMIKKVTYLIHTLADMHKQEYKEIQDKCKKQFSYTNLAQVTLSDGHAIITKLIELTGGEEGTHIQNVVKSTISKESDGEKGINEKEIPILNTSEMKELETEIGKLAVKLQICVRKSHEIVEEEIGKENITEGTRATLVKSFAATLFIEASRRGVGR